MTVNNIVSRFAKCGDLRHLSRRFHNLSIEARRVAVDLILSGVDPEKAIKQAKKVS